MTGNKGALQANSDREAGILDLARRHLALGLTGAHDEQLVDVWARGFGGISVPRSHITWDISRAREGVTRFSVDLTSATDFDKLDSLGWVQPPWRGLRGGFRDSHKIRASWPDAARVVAVLAAFYLSRAGGGTRDRQGAWDLLCAHIPDAPAESMQEYHKLLRQIRKLFGPLLSRSTTEAA